MTDKLFQWLSEVRGDPLAFTLDAIDEMQEKANAYIAALQAQRNAALDQVVALTAELEKAKKAKECAR